MVVYSVDGVPRCVVRAHTLNPQPSTPRFRKRCFDFEFDSGTASALAKRSTAWRAPKLTFLSQRQGKINLYICLHETGAGPNREIKLVFGADRSALDGRPGDSRDLRIVRFVRLGGFRRRCFQVSGLVVGV